MHMHIYIGSLPLSKNLITVVPLQVQSNITTAAEMDMDGKFLCTVPTSQCRTVQSQSLIKRYLSCTWNPKKRLFSELELMRLFKYLYFLLLDTFCLISLACSFSLLLKIHCKGWKKIFSFLCYDLLDLWVFKSCKGRIGSIVHPFLQYSITLTLCIFTSWCLVTTQLLLPVTFPQIWYPYMVHIAFNHDIVPYLPRQFPCLGEGSLMCPLLTRLSRLDIW